MSAAELRITYKPDEDGTGEIIAIARSGAFSARGSAWFNPDHVKKAFLAGLLSYPFRSEDPPAIEGGFWKGGNIGVLDQCHLRIMVKPYNTRGMLLLHADFASEVWKTPDADLQNSATIRFLTEYAAVDGFAVQFEKVLDGEMEEAILKGATT
jgi:hypothetical protein